jgi:hypothetical protein
MPSKPRGIAPHFLVEDVARAAEYYRDKLGSRSARTFKFLQYS